MCGKKGLELGVSPFAPTLQEHPSVARPQVRERKIADSPVRKTKIIHFKENSPAMSPVRARLATKAQGDAAGLGSVGCEHAPFWSSAEKT